MLRKKFFTADLKQVYYFIRQGVQPIGLGKNKGVGEFYFVFPLSELESKNLFSKWNNGGYKDRALYFRLMNEYANNIDKEKVVTIFNPYQAYFYIERGLNPLELIQVSKKKIAFIFNKRKSNPLFSEWLAERNKIKESEI